MSLFFLPQNCRGSGNQRQSVHISARCALPLKKLARLVALALSRARSLFRYLRDEVGSPGRQYLFSVLFLKSWLLFVVGSINKCSKRATVFPCRLPPCRSLEPGCDKWGLVRRTRFLRVCERLDRRRRRLL